MDPFLEHTLKIYNHFLRNSSDNFSVECDIKWPLLACEMVLKEKSVDSAVHLRVLNYLLELIKGEPVLTDNNWIFVIDCTRKGIKRTGNSEVIAALLNFINDNIQNLKSVNELVKLILTCKDYGINAELFGIVEDLYKNEKVLKVDFDEFHFIETSISEHYMKQRCQRLLILLDPLKGLQMFPGVTDDYCFALFSISDSELIGFMKRLLRADEKRFLQFYNHVITNDLLSVDFFIDQLLTDSVELLELLLAVFDLKLARANRHFKNFHRLLLLKLEMSSEAFPFNCKFLLKKLELFLKAYERK